MCGISGYLNLDGEPASREILRAMTDVIAHRGPDGQGQYTDGGLGLGHRRLAILELTEAGAQPMETDDGRYVITFNGEIYNFQELRTELEGLGWRFKSRSDTEVLLKGYAQWGRGVLPKLNGMFGFAIWDRKERELCLARDRYGVKPVYLSWLGDTLVFASEIKSILKHPLSTARVDKGGLAEYLTFQNLFTSRTLFQGVELLPAGTSLVVNAEGRRKFEQYWDFSFEEPEHGMPEEEAVEEVDRLFRQAVKRQLISDVDVGSYLSGGMDSGAITAIAAQNVPLLRTFTCGFDLRSASGLEMNFDERGRAEHMSWLFRTEHYEMVLKSGDMERVMPRFAYHLEEPRVGQSYPNFYAAQLASKFVKVCLSGAGGDELFGGYPWRYYRAAVNANFEDYVDKYFAYWQRLLPQDAAARVLAPMGKDAMEDMRQVFRGVFKTHAEKLTRPEDYINHSLYFEAKTFLHGLLVVEDKLSMAHSLETRVPFLDNDLADFAMKLPISLKLRNLGEVVRLNENDSGAKAARYFQRTNDGKLVLRKVMSKYVPDTISDGEKQGFSAPDASWFKGESIDYVKSRLMNSDARIWSFIDSGATLDLVREHLDGKQNRRLLVWSLLNLESLLQGSF